MKLELKHLAGYLPYELKGFIKLENGGLSAIVNINLDLVCAAFSIKDNFKIKPILRPLSELTRIELEKAGFMYYIDYLTYENQGVEWTLRAPYEMVVYLLSQHYDIYGLSEVGLAMDINMLNK